MRLLVLVTIFLSSFFISHGQEDSLMLIQGMELHDNDDYAGAIKVYDSIILRNSNYYSAYYEKSFSLYSAARYQDCIDLCRLIIKKYPYGKDIENVYVNYGSALDGMSRPDEAIKIYKEGLRRFPATYILHYNKGITEYYQKSYTDAVVDFEHAVSFNPGHASSHQYLAYSIYSRNKIAAVMSLSVFLLLEHSGERAVKNLKLLQQLMGGDVAQKDDNSISIGLSPAALDTKRKGEDDFHVADMSISLRSALDHDKEYKRLTLAEKLKYKLDILSEISSKKGFFSTFYVPFFAKLKADGFTDVACYVIYASSGDIAIEKWIEQNQDRITAFYKWLNAYRWDDQ